MFVVIRFLNPYEAVSIGAAIQAAIMTNDKNEYIETMMILDVSPFSLGVETVGGVMTVLIPRNSTVPTKKTQIFSNYSDNQTNFLVNIYEGERQLVKDNLLLDNFILEGIPQLQRGQTQIEVEFNLDGNNNLNVTAVEKSKGVKKKKQIYPKKGRLNDEDILKLKLLFKEEEEKLKNEDILNLKLKFEEEKKKKLDI